MSMVRREQEVEFWCSNSCARWHVEGRFNAEGRFQPIDDDDLVCVDCESTGIPVDDDVEVA